MAILALFLADESDKFADLKKIADKIIPSDPWAFLVQLLATFILVLILAKFLVKPARKYISERQAYIQGNLDEANNKNIEADEKLADAKVNEYILGNGDTVIAQYPVENSYISSGQKVFLVTDTNNFIMPDLTGWTSKEVTALWSVTQFGFKLEGEGVVKSQNIAPGTPVTKGTEIEVVFEQ